MNTLRAFYSLLGALLLSTALIKLLSLFFGEVPSTIIKPAVLVMLTWIVIPIEVAVGCLNICRKPDRLTRNINFVLFGSFCVLLAYLLVTGVSRCGCLGNLDVESGSMLALDFLIVVAIVLLGADCQSKAIADKFVFLFPMILVAAGWALAPSVSEKLRQRAMTINEVTATLAGNPEFEIDPLNGFRETVEVVVHNRRTQAVIVASAQCDWCVLTARVLEGSVTLESGETRTITVELIRPRPVDYEQAAQMEIDARNGLPVSKVPYQITIRLSLFPDKANVEPSFAVPTRSSKSYGNLWGADL